MIITCGQCRARFKVVPEQIKEKGSKVRCSSCQHVFTVYRQPKAETKPNQPQAVVPSQDVDSFLKSLAGDDDNNSPRPDKKEAPFEGRGIYDQIDDSQVPDDEPHLGSSATSDELSLKERRDRRRRLYSDLDEGAKENASDLPGKDSKATTKKANALKDEEYEDYDDSYEDEYEDDYEDDYEDEYEDEYEDNDYDDEDKLKSGLAAEPAQREDGARPVTVGIDAQGNSAAVRPAITYTKKSSTKLIVILLVIAIVLGGVIWGVMKYVNPPTALTGDTPAETVAETNSPMAEDDVAGAAKITFPKNNQTHYFRNNSQAGNILIITGIVRNGYDHARKFIRLRGVLLGSDGEPLADRFVYAGNIISEAELTSLPINEILARLSIKGGQNGMNMDVKPDQEIPFMLVFDRMPEGVEQFRIDPVGSMNTTEE